MGKMKCPVCKDNSPNGKLYCCGDCAVKAKKWMRTRATRPCHDCRKWKRPDAFDGAAQICMKCRPPKKRLRRAFKARKQCQHCGRAFQPRCNAQKFCKVKCRDAEGDKREHPKAEEGPG